MNVNIATAARLLCSLQAKRVLVLGDVMLDRFVDGAVTRISPEAPVPILSQSRVRQMPGGLQMWPVIWHSWGCMFI